MSRELEQAHVAASASTANARRRRRRRVANSAASATNSSRWSAWDGAKVQPAELPPPAFLLPPWALEPPGSALEAGARSSRAARRRRGHVARRVQQRSLRVQAGAHRLPTRSVGGTARIAAQLFERHEAPERAPLVVRAPYGKILRAVAAHSCRSRSSRAAHPERGALLGLAVFRDDPDAVARSAERELPPVRRDRAAERACALVHGLERLAAVGALHQARPERICDAHVDAIGIVRRDARDECQRQIARELDRMGLQAQPAVVGAEHDARVPCSRGDEPSGRSARESLGAKSTLSGEQLRRKQAAERRERLSVVFRQHQLRLELIVE